MVVIQSIRITIQAGAPPAGTPKNIRLVSEEGGQNSVRVPAPAVGSAVSLLTHQLDSTGGFLAVGLGQPPVHPPAGEGRTVAPTSPPIQAPGPGHRACWWAECPYKPQSASFSSKASIWYAPQSAALRLEVVQLLPPTVADRWQICRREFCVPRWTAPCRLCACPCTPAPFQPPL